MAVIFSYNVNGIRAAVSKGLHTWLKAAAPDIVCLQEIKALPSQIPVALFEELGYHCFWFPAEKKGYSGVAILSKAKPEHVEYGCGIDQSDSEGRVLRADFGDFSVMSVYVPSGSSGDIRQAYKMRWLGEFDDYISHLKQQHPKLVISGDYNICHQAIDIHDPVRNARNSGFLPEEREWIGSFISSGFVDTFRHLNKAPHHYSWWSNRSGARANNKGWRIDYHMVSSCMTDQIAGAGILPDIIHSDHCPVVVRLEAAGPTVEIPDSERI